MKSVRDMNKLDLLAGLDVKTGATSDGPMVRKLSAFDLARLVEFRRRVLLAQPDDMNLIDLRLRVLPEVVSRLENFDAGIDLQIEEARHSYRRGYLTGAICMWVLILAFTLVLLKAGVFHVG